MESPLNHQRSPCSFLWRFYQDYVISCDLKRLPGLMPGDYTYMTLKALTAGAEAYRGHLCLASFSAVQLLFCLDYTIFKNTLIHRGGRRLSLGVVSTMPTFPISHLSQYVVFIIIHCNPLNSQSVSKRKTRI